MAVALALVLVATASGLAGWPTRPDSDPGAAPTPGSSGRPAPADADRGPTSPDLGAGVDDGPTPPQRADGGSGAGESVGGGSTTGGSVAGGSGAGGSGAGGSVAGGSTTGASAASSLEPGAVDRTSLDLRATYHVRATIGWANRQLAVETRIDLLNESGGPIDHIVLNTVAGPLGRLRGLSVDVDGRSVPATLADQTIRVPFGGVLPDGGTVEVVVRYRATVRSDLAGPSGSAWLFTRTTGILDLYRWIPWLSREHPFARPNHGDPFVTAVSPRVTLDLRADRPLRYAVNGRRITTSDGGRRQVFVAEHVRDVVLTAAPDFRTARGRVGDTEIEVVARPGAPAAALLREARRALERLERLLGPYPYPKLVVAESAGGYALEGPGIVWVPRGVATSRLPYLVTHELGHQWFYGLVGNDQAAEPFADEAITDMVTRYVLGMRRAPRCTSGRLDRSIYTYSAACYYERIYVAGGNLLDDLRRRMGNAAFFGALRTYIDDHRFGLGSTADLVETLDAATPIDVRAFMGRLLPSLRPGAS